MNLKNLLKNILSPPVCVFCHCPLHIESQSYICAKCALNLPYNNGKRCQICCSPLDIAYGDLYCAHCKKTKRAFAQNVSRYIYKDNVAEAIKRMKFGKRQLWIADCLGKFLAETIKKSYDNVAFDLVLFVPISKKRLREREFNQSEIIADAVCKNLKLPIAKDVLIKPIDIPKQSGLSFEKRKKNVKEAFKIKNPDCVIDKTILLIDDIFTTGATLNECAKTLKKVGAAVVFCATIASTQLYA